jgi:hypothetical protein
MDIAFLKANAYDGYVRRDNNMLNFEEELKKFKPCLEVEDIEEAVYQEDLTDMTDILKEYVQQK